MMTSVGLSWFFWVHINKIKEEDDELALIVIFFGCIETKQDVNERRFVVVFFELCTKKKKKRMTNWCLSPFSLGAQE
jgi:hypothetical protein